MLHIILLILKIIGIILLTLLLIVIALLALILFVPVRYTLKAEYNDKFTFEANISWLLRAVRARISFYDKFDIKAKALMFTIYGEKKSRKKADKQAKKELKNTAGNIKNVFDDEEDKEYSAITGSNINQSNSTSITSTSDTGCHKTTNTSHNEADTKHHIELDDIKLSADTNEPQSKKKKSSVKRKTEKKSFIGFFRWIKLKIRAFIDKIVLILKTIKAKIKALIEGINSAGKNASDKAKAFLDTITDNRNKELVTFLLSQLKILIRKIKPRKYRIYLHYGFEDSYTTGQISVYLAALYGIIGLNMDVNPDFENSIIEGSIYLKGRVRIISLGIIALRVYRNELFRKIILDKK